MRRALHGKMYILQTGELLLCREAVEAAYLLTAFKATHPQVKKQLISAWRFLPNCHLIHWLLSHDLYVRPVEVMYAVLLSFSR